MLTQHALRIPLQPRFRECLRVGDSLGRSRENRQRTERLFGVMADFGQHGVCAKFALKVSRCAINRIAAVLEDSLHFSVHVLRGGIVA